MLERLGVSGAQAIAQHLLDRDWKTERRTCLEALRRMPPELQERLRPLFAKERLSTARLRRCMQASGASFLFQVVLQAARLSPGEVLCVHELLSAPATEASLISC